MASENNVVPAPAHSTHSTVAVERKSHGFRRKMVGRVIRDKMDKTVVVEVVNARRDPLYGKYVRTRSRFKAHDEKNEFRIGDQVEIQEHSPISRDKRFKVVRLVKKFVEE
ncbi:30S ribosomal protein S17 [Pendulispora albinea]|uniref:Small ribosomal subunit protein uS17 n=1 Tax=Pendulispora albinea TaxID=2741071 RepID=A0ABZ2M138_9BACT